MARRLAVGYLESVDPLLMQPHYPVFADGVELGRDAEQCEVILSRHYVSRRHCRIVEDGGGLVLSDCGSTNGTFVNGEKITHRALAEGDQVGLGQASPHHFVFARTLRGSERKYLLPLQAAYRIGRSSNNELPLSNDPTVSSAHACVRVKSGALALEDLGSANGTFVNGHAVSYAEIGQNDLVRIGFTEMRFERTTSGLLVVLNEKRNRLRLEALGLTRQHREKTLLRGINLVIEPGEYVGVLGPSGAGKSTLLNALNGFAPANAGSVLLNGESLYKSYDMFRNTIGYVPQDDIIHRELSVERCLVYTGQLRLPRDTGAETLGQQVTSVIETLGLSHVRQNLVSNLSGGQRKRVSIGCELLTKPSLMFLDEPTSGLDPSTEEKLMRHFRQMSEQGQSVILTTHILYNLDLLDMVVLMARGRLVYFGPVSEVCGFFRSPDHSIERPIEIFDLLEPETPDSMERERRAEFYERKYLESRLFQEFVVNRASSPIVRPDGVEVASAGSTASVGPKDSTLSSPKAARRRRMHGLIGRVFQLRQFGILTRRALDLKLSLPSRLGVPMITPLVLAALTATTEIRSQVALDRAAAEFSAANANLLSMIDRSGAVIGGNPLTGGRFLELLFEGFGNMAVPISLPLTMVMTAVFLGTLSACLEISGERAIYLRERAVNLSIPTYIASKLPALFLLSAVQGFAYVALSMLILRPAGVDILSIALICVGVSWVSCTIGLFISSLDPTPGQNSVILAVIAVLPQMIFSGAMAPAFYGGMNTVTQFIASALPARWGFELMLTVFYRDPAWAREVITGPYPDGMGFQFGEAVYHYNALALAALACAYFLATCAILKRYDRL